MAEDRQCGHAAQTGQPGQGGFGSHLYILFIKILRTAAGYLPINLG